MQVKLENFNSNFCPKEWKKLTKDFKPTKNWKSMLQTLWSYSTFHEQNITVIVDKKDNAKASDFLFMGDECLKNENPYMALSMYSQSITNAETDADSQSNNLALGYMNRSALLSKLGEYEKSIKDIKRAIDATISGSEEMIVKQKELLRLQNENRKRKMASVKQDREVDTSRQSDKALLPCCKEEMLLKQGTASLSDWKTKYGFISTNDHVFPPEMESSNPRVPSLSSSANIGDSKEKGRHVYATKDIYPGEIVSKEIAYAYSPCFKLSKDICSFCAIPTFIPVPCHSCCSVVFCGEECRRAAYKAFHKLECPIVKCLLKEDPTGRLLMLVRMLFRTPFGKLKKLFDIYNEEQKSKFPNRIRGFDEAGNFSSSDLRAIYHTASNLRGLSPDKMVNSCFQALKLMQLVVGETPYLGRKRRLSASEKLDEECLDLAVIIARLRLVCLWLSTDTRKVYSPDGSLEEKESGVLIYATHRIFNHSCYENVTLYNYGTTTIGRAHRFIQSGTELTLNYNVQLEKSNLEYRRDLLQVVYGFYCRCEACENEWEFNSPKCYELQCPTCKKGLHVKKGCLNCQSNEFVIPPAFDSFGEITVSAQRLNEIIKSLRSYHSFTVLEAENLKGLCEGIGLMNYFTKQPSQEQSRLQALFYFNYQLRAFHIHDRNN